MSIRDGVNIFAHYHHLGRLPGILKLMIKRNYVSKYLEKPGMLRGL